VTAVTRWGILGCASIAVDHVIPAMRQVPGALPWALASRDHDRARRCGRRLGIDRAYGSYQQLLEDPGVDAVYVALPNQLHHWWAREAMSHGKSVLVEKPAVLCADDARELQALARNEDRLIVEGFMFRHHGQWAFLRDWAGDNLDPGAPALLRVHIGFHLDAMADTRNIRWRADLGGGALFDLGSYAVAAATSLFGRARTARLLQLRQAPAGVDLLSAGTLAFPDNRVAVFDCDFQHDWVNTPVELRTRDACVVLEHAFNPGGHPTEVRVLRQGHPPDVYRLPGQNAYAAMVGQFCHWRPDGARSAFARHEAERLVASALGLELLLADLRCVDRDGDPHLPAATR
jgi:predicted dehydrogenase